MTININKIRLFTNESDEGAFSVVRVHRSLIPKLGGRNSWIKITHDGKSIYRMVKGRMPARGFTAQSMELDYDSWVELGFNGSGKKDMLGFYNCDFEIHKATRPERFLAHWLHPDPAHRVPMQFGVFTFLLGYVIGAAELVVNLLSKASALLGG